jgi:hypothetical protein
MTTSPNKIVEFGSRLWLREDDNSQRNQYACLGRDTPLYKQLIS